MARLSPTQAVEADRMWKAPDHQPPTPGPSHNRWKSRPPSAARDSHSYTQPRRGRTGTGEEDKTSLYYDSSIYSLMVGRPSLPPAPLKHHRPSGRQHPHQDADANAPSLDRPSSWTATSPT